jgi:hypothetical protein
MQDDPDNVDRLIDQAIDDVARGMTGARPVDGIEGFARRVSARLHDTRAARPWPRAWLLVPAAGAVLLAAFLVVDRRDGNVRPISSARTTEVKKPDTTTETASGLRAEGSGLSQDQPSALSPQPSGSSVGPQPSTLSAQPLVRPRAVAEPPADLATIAPLEVERIDVSPLVVVMPIEISVIAIERIEISAMP